MERLVRDLRSRAACELDRAAKMFAESKLLFRYGGSEIESLYSALELNKLAIEKFLSAQNTFRFISELRQKDVLD